MKDSETIHRPIARSFDFDSVTCTIDAEDVKFISSLLRNNYSNPVLAVIREIYCNAIDANSENNKDASGIIVTVPTTFNPIFSVRDNGKGLSPEMIRNLYSKYGKSSKRNSNTQTGFFGIGKFAPLSYNKDGFTLTSYYNGEKRVYFMYVSEENDSKIDELSCEPSSEESGVEISVAVKLVDVNTFRSNCVNFFRYFNPLPKFTNLEEKIGKEDSYLNAKDWFIVNSDKFDSCNKIIMGGVPYPLTINQISNFNSPMAEIRGLRLTVPIGAVKLHHSREMLEYNAHTQSYLRNRLNEIFKELQSIVQKEFVAIDCYKLAKAKYADMRRNLPRDIFNILVNSNSFSWNGITISSALFDNMTFDATPQITNVKIPVKIRSFTKSGNGSVSHRRCWSPHSDGDYCYVFNDMDSGAKIIQRIYPLFDKYKEVFVVAHCEETSNPYNVIGWQKYFEVNHFDKAKNDVFHLSKLSLSKLPSNNVANNYTKPSYFLVYNGVGFRECNVNDLQIINDINTKKLYFPIANRELTDKYKVDKHFYHKFSIKFADLTDAHVFFVSTAVCNSEKFKKRTDFIDFNQYVSDYFNNLSQEVKDHIALVIQNKPSIDNKSRFNFLKQFAVDGYCQELAHCIKNFETGISYFEKNKFTKLLNIISEFSENIYSNLRIDFSASTHAKANVAIKNIFNKYKLLKYAADARCDYYYRYNYKECVVDAGEIEHVKLYLKAIDDK